MNLHLALIHLQRSNVIHLPSAMNLQVMILHQHLVMKRWNDIARDSAVARAKAKAKAKKATGTKAKAKSKGTKERQRNKKEEERSKSKERYMR